MKDEHVIVGGICVVVAGITGFIIGRKVERRSVIRVVEKHAAKKKTVPVKRKGPILNNCEYHVVDVAPAA